MSVEQILNCDPASLIAVLIIAVFSNWLSYRFGRHNTRIDEFNRLRDEIAPLFKGEFEYPVPLFCDIDDAKLENLASLMHPWQRKGFTESVRAYHEAQGGEFESIKNTQILRYKDPKPVSAAAAKVLTYLKRR